MGAVARRRVRHMAFDERTGAYVEAKTLRRDGESGIWTQDPDPPHPLKFRRSFGVDESTAEGRTPNPDKIGSTFYHGFTGYADQPGKPLLPPAIAVIPGVPEFAISSAPTVDGPAAAIAETGVSLVSASSEITVTGPDAAEAETAFGGIEVATLIAGPDAAEASTLLASISTATTIAGPDAAEAQTGLAAISSASLIAGPSAAEADTGFASISASALIAGPDAADAATSFATIVIAITPAGPSASAEQPHGVVYNPGAWGEGSWGEGAWGIGPDQGGAF